MLNLISCKNESEDPKQAALVATASIGELKIAYVNIDTLQEKYKKTADLQEELIQYKATLEAKFKVEYDKYISDAQEANRQLSTLSPEETQILQNKFAQREASLSEYQSNLEGQAYDYGNKKTNEYIDEIHQFIKAYSMENGYNAVFARGELNDVLYMDQSFDITQVIVDSLNVLYDKDHAETAEEE